MGRTKQKNKKEGEFFSDFHSLHGCEGGSLFWHSDARGDFSKFIDDRFFQRHPQNAVKEVFFNRSKRGVIRGFHLQWPPAGHAKLVACLSGSFCDVLLDLREDSPTYKDFAMQVLSPGKYVYMPNGVAHAFQALDDMSVMLYATTSDHNPELDGGVNPLTCGVPWPIVDFTISDRDRALPSLKEIKERING